MNTPTPTPRTDAAWSATFDSEQMSAGRTARALRECSQQLETELATLTAERDQLRAENATFRAAQKACEACDEPTAFEVRQLRARAERAEAELVAERARLDSGQILLTVAGERVWHCGVDLRAAIDAGIREGAK